MENKLKKYISGVEKDFIKDPCKFILNFTSEENWVKIDEILKIVILSTNEEDSEEAATVLWSYVHFLKNYKKFLALPEIIIDNLDLRCPENMVRFEFYLDAIINKMNKLSTEGFEEYFFSVRVEVFDRIEELRIVSRKKTNAPIFSRCLAKSKLISYSIWGSDAEKQRDEE